MYQKWLIQFFTVLFIFVYQVNSQLERTCITPNNQPANCTSVYKCQTFLDILKTSTSSQRKYMKESLCGHYRNIPIVCCGTDTDYIKQSSRSKRELNRNPAIPESNCGKSLSDGSVVGNTVKEHDFPWTVRLGYNNTPKFSCEGTLINKRYVLTAGVCIEPKTLKRVGNLSTIRLGDQNCPTVESKCEKSNVVDAGVEKVILHPTYSSSPKLHDDIGLIRLDRDITFNDDVAPICLPRPNEAAKPDDKVVEVGWYKNSENKLQAPITVASKEQCNERYKKLGVVLTEKQMCAGGYPDNKCAGTSGGPLNRYVGDSWVIEGITSFGTVTCNSDFPTVFTKVEPYLQWIHDNVQN